MRRLTAIVAVVATFTTLSLLAVGPAQADNPPTITGPARVYPVENTTMNFTGADPVSGEVRLISVDGTIEGNNCDDSTGNNYSPDDCPRIQMDISSPDAGLLNIPGLVVKSDSPDGIDHTVAPSGAVVTNSSNGTDPSELIDFNGTQAQLNDTLQTLQFIPSADYRESTLDPDQLPDLHTVVINGDGGLQADIDTQVKVEGPNQAPAVVVHQSPLKANIGQTADFIDDADVTDPEMCTATICGLPYTNSTPIADPDSNMLLVAWLDQDCGKFNFLGADFSNNGSATNNNVDSLLLNSLIDDNQDNGYNSDQRTAIEANLPAAALALDLTQETGTASQDTAVFAGVSDLDNVDYALAHIEYTGPAAPKTCVLHTAVSDLGNLGTPKQYVDNTNPTYEIPDAQAATGDITFDVQDTHPHVTVEQTIPGPVPGVDPTHTSANYTVTFDQAVSSFDASDISTTGSDAGLSISCLALNVVPNTVWSLSCKSDKDGTIKVSVPAGMVYAQMHDGEATFANAASTSSDNEITWDATDPTETIDPDTDAGQLSPTGTSPISYTVNFSEKTTALVPGTFTGSDIDLSQSTAGGTLVASVSGPNLPLHPNQFTVTVTGMTTMGNVVASVKPNVVLDQALNPNDASTSMNDDNIIAWQPATSAPTVTVEQAAGQADPTNGSPIAFVATFSEPVTGFSATGVDLSASTAGGTLQAVVTGGPSTYDIAVSGMTSNGVVAASIPSGAAMNSGSQGNSASTSVDNQVSFDNMSPTVTVEQAATQGDPTNVATIDFTATFSEPVTGFAGTDVDLASSTAGGPLVAAVTGGPTIWTIGVSGMSSDGEVIASIPAGVLTDLAGNPNDASTSNDNSVHYKTGPSTSPDVTINQANAQADPTNSSPITFDVVFSEAVTGFTAADVTLGGTANPSTAQVTGSGTTYSVSVSGMAQDGTVTASIPAGAAMDAFSNPSNASTSTDNTVTYDTTAPTVTINQASGQADPTNASPVEFTVVFSEAVNGFTAADVTLGGTAGASTATVTGSGTTYTVDVSGMAQSGTVIATILGNALQDPAGNGNFASTSTDNTVQFNKPVNNTPPSVTINQAAGQPDPVNSSPIMFDVVFSEPVTGFDASDVTLGGTGNPTVVHVTGSGATYSVAVGGMTKDGTVKASIPAGAAVDAASNPNTASTSTDNTVTYDTTLPVVTINQAAGQADPTNHSPITFTTVFSEPVFGFTAADVVLGGTAHPTTAQVSGTGPTYSVAVSGMTGSGTVTASIAPNAVQDAAGNQSESSTSTDHTVTYDVTAPSVSVNQASGQADPTTHSPIAFKATFSESVTGFTASDVHLSGTAHAAHVVVTGSGSSYAVSVSGMTAMGTVIATIPAGAAHDSAGNLSKASTSSDDTVHFTGDTTKPKVTVNQASGQSDPTKGTTIKFTATFSEKVLGFTASDVVVNGTADPKHATISGSGPAYTISVTGMTRGGTVLASIPAGRVTDLSGNPNLASTTTNGQVTYNPTITVISGGHHVSLSVKGGVLVSFKAVPPAVPPPPGEKFVGGPFSFVATCKPGALVTFTLTLAAHPNVYAKLRKGKWAAFTWDGTTGARINGNVVTIVIRDNGRGDSDASKGVVSDPGVLAESVPAGAAAPLSTTGENFLVLGEIAFLLIAAGAMLAATTRRRRRS